jgi:uncharacterized membrane protein YfcA
MEELIIFGTLALVAEVIGTISGFGSSILFVPIASLFFDFHVVLGITAVFHVFSNVAKILLFKKGIDKNIALKLGIPAVIFVTLGALLSSLVASEIIEAIMGILLIGLALFLSFNHKFQLAQSDKNLYLGGISSGFLAGLIGTGGAIRGITMLAFNLEKNIFIATSALIDLGVDSSRAIVYIYAGYFEVEHIRLIPMLIVVSFLGSFIGKKILEHVSQTIFKYIALIVICITSLVMLIQFIRTY